MIAGKAIDLLKSFTPGEFRQFGLFVSSPWFNKEKVIVKLYGQLKKYYPSFESRGFEKQKIFSRLFPSKKYNDGIMRNILSKLLELEKKFIVYSSVRFDEFNYSVSLLRGLADKKQAKLFEKEFIYAEDYISSLKIFDGDYYKKKSLLEAAKRDFLVKQKSALSRSDESLTKFSEYQTMSFIIHTLDTNTQLINTARHMFGYNLNPGQFMPFENYLNSEADKFRNNLYVRYHYNTYKLALTEDEKYFFALKDVISNEIDGLKDRDKKDILTVLTNFCYIKINKGELKFMYEQFNLIRKKIELGYYLESGNFISHLFFMNAVITGLEAGEVSWVKEFIDLYKSQLDEKNRDNTICFCNSLVYLHNNELGAALAEAAKVMTEDLSYKHQLKSLYLKIYYEMNDLNLFESHVDAYKHFIANDSFIEQANKEVIRNYVNITQKLFEVKNNENEKDYRLHRLKDEVINNKAMINKPWLLKKINELE